MAFGDGTVARVAVECISASLGQRTVMVLHYDLEDALYPQQDPSIRGLADAVRAALVGPLQALYRSEWSMGTVVATAEKDPLNPDAAREQVSRGATVTGAYTTSGDLLPTACCVLFNLQTARIGRSFRGRIFMGGSYTEGDQAAGVWQNPTGAGGLARAIAVAAAIPRQPDLTAGWSSAAATWVVYSATRRARNQTPYVEPITSANYQTEVRWLRSRQPGR